jgi:hypothetical protein
MTPPKNVSWNHVDLRSRDALPGFLPLPRADGWTWRGEEGRRVGAARSRLRRAEYRQSGIRPQVRFDEYDRRVRILLVAVGALLVIGGLVWVAQGLNLPFAPRSFMTADRTWIVIGAVAVMAGGVLVWWGRRTA